MNLLQFLRHSPDAAVLTSTLGIVLIYVELNRPGVILAGAVGLVLLLLGIAGLSTQPVTLTGLALLAMAALTLALGLRRKVTLLFALLATTEITSGCVLLVRGGDRRVHLATALLAGIVLGAGTSMLTLIARRARVNKGLD